MSLKTTDNNCGKDKINSNDLADLQIIANVNINQISLENNNNLLVFPDCFDKCRDKIYDKSIFSLQGDILTTGNIMGFVGVNETQLTIQSRFAKEDKDYFLHYMLQKVFSVNLFDLKHKSSQENIFDFLLYLFPYYLKKALNQGLYKEYIQSTYNNANVKGSIDVKRQIKNNIPFNGKIAYRVREHSFDNKITQLIRHTIEFIQKHKFASQILTNDSDTQSFAQQIVQATPSYNYNQRKTIINQNIRPVFHPYYSEYNGLQQICIKILRFEGLKFGQNDNKIYGLLFDGAWLWEEYLNIVLKDYGFKHPLNKEAKGAIYLFKDSRKYPRYPDFWKDDFIIDAKYKRLNESKIDREDIHQLISYMYVMQAKSGGFIFPIEESKYPKNEELGRLNGYGGKVNIWSLSISAETGTFNEFCSRMIENENELMKKLIFFEETQCKTTSRIDYPYA